MTNELSTSENTINVKLTPSQPVATQAPSSGSGSTFVSPTVVKPKAGPLNGLKTICYDTETSGVNPWDYQFYVVSFWDLSKPVSTMETFASFNEERLTRDVADYLNREKPGALLQYNNGFDQRCLLTRFMLWQVPVPGWNEIQHLDMMEILKKGTTQNIYSSQAVGSEENWLKFFYNEEKPYTIEECFEGVRNNDLRPFIIRNRTCVEGVGSIYLLFRAMTDGDFTNPVGSQPTHVNLDEAQEQGIVLETCNVCGASNEVKIGSKNNTCWRCLNYLPDPDPSNIIKEVLREVDNSKVGLK